MGPSKRIAPGTVFGGDYVVERTLAAGGMGAVYVARQRSTDKLRALKTLLPEHVSDAGMRQRFAREAMASSRIESDHVVEVLAAGVDEATGIPWLVMEFLQGDDLAAVAKQRGTLSRPELLEAAHHLGHALTAAHRSGVVHRDLKPENLFLATARRDGASFTLKVLDFGIARLLDAKTSLATTSAMGSPLWMAPEQTDSALPITPATDVWAVGLIMFWALTGGYFWLTPRQGDGTLGSMIRELVVEPLPSASARAAHFGVADRLPPGFDAWFARCVCRDAQGRFRDASECFPPLYALLEGGVPSYGVAPVAQGVAYAPTQAHTAASMLTPTTPGAPTAVPYAPPNAVPAQGPSAPQVTRSKTPYVIAGVLAAGLVAVVAAIALRSHEATPATEMGTVPAAVPTVTTGDPSAAAPRATEVDPTLVGPQAPADPSRPGVPGVPSRPLPPGFDAGRIVIPLDAGATSVPLDAPTDRPVAPVDLGSPSAPVDVSVPVDQGSPVVIPPPDVTQTPPPPPDVPASTPAPTPEPPPQAEGCERFSNCSTCLAETGCGWCNRAGRCLRGNWARGPDNSACSGDDWVGSADHCDDRCARQSNCSSCLAETGCGWCQNANRCVSGNWARGPYHGACSGENWVGSADHCDDRCGRQTNCAACVHESGCGWCGNVRRCVSGNWARGPYHGACGESDWAGTSSSCP